MTDTQQHEQELTQLMEEQQHATLATWHRERTHEELTSFIYRRISLLDDAA